MLMKAYKFSDVNLHPKNISAEKEYQAPMIDFFKNKKERIIKGEMAF